MNIVFEKNQLTHEPNMPITLPYKPRILIVEDDISLEPIWDYAVRQFNTQASYVWVTSGKAADNAYMTQLEIGRPFDLVISDIFLSDQQTGIDLWEKYAHLLDGRFILTSEIEPSRLSRYLHQHAGNPTYLRKPLDPHQCVDAIYFALSERSA